MPKKKATSPARSQGGTTPKRKKTRGSRSLCSPALSTASGRLTSLIDQFQDKNMESFALSPLNGRSVLNDNTEIEEPRRKSWWKKLDENSQDVMEVLENNKLPVNNPIEEFIDIEVLSQEKKNYTLDLPESSDNESIHSIVLPQRRLFTQKENEPQKKYGQLIDNRESLAKLHKANNTNIDKTVNVGTRNLFQNAKRSKPIFPAALLNISPNKTAADKTRDNVLADPKPQVRNIFGNRPANKRKNMFADFIVSESEDEIPDIQPKVFGFQKKLEQRRISSASRGREASPASSITTDIEMDFRIMLPSSTMVENELEDMVESTPVKRARLSKLSEAKESDGGTNTIQTDITADKTKQSNKSTSSKNKSKASTEIIDKSLDSSRTTRSFLKNASKREESVNTSLIKDAKGNKSKSKITSRLTDLDVSPSKSDTETKLSNKSAASKNKSKASPEIIDKSLDSSRTTRSILKNASKREESVNTSLIKDAKGNKSKSKITSRLADLDVSPSKSDTETKQSNKSAASKNKYKASPEIIDKSLDSSRTTRNMLKSASKREESVNTSLKRDSKGNKSESKITSRLNELDVSPSKSDTDKNATLYKSQNQNKSKTRNSPKALKTDIQLEENVGNVVNATRVINKSTNKSLPNTTNKSFNEKERTVTIKVHDKVDETLTNDVEQNEEEDDENNFTLQYENDDEVLDEAEVSIGNEKDNTKKHNTVVLEKDIQQAEINKAKRNKSSLANQTIKKTEKTVEESVESQTDQYTADDNVDGNQVQNQEEKDEEMLDQEFDEGANNSDDKNEDMEQENEDDVNVSQENEEETNKSEDNQDAVNVTQEDVEEPSENQEVANDSQEVENENESKIEEDEDNESEKEEDEANESQEVEVEVNESQQVANESQEAKTEEENENEDDEADQSEEADAEVNESQEVANESEEDEDQANQSQEVEAEVSKSQEVANDSEEDEDQANQSQEVEAEVNESQEVANDSEEDEDQANQNQEVDAEVNESQEVANDSEEDKDQANESQEVANDSEEDEDQANESQEAEAEVNESLEVANDNEEDENQANENQEVEAEVNESQEVANDSEEDEDQANESQEVEAEVNESQEVANDSEEDDDQANESQEVEAEVNENQEVANDSEEDEDQANESQEVEAEANATQEVENESEGEEDEGIQSREVENDNEESHEVESDAEVNENEEVEDNEQVNDSDEADQAIATDPEISDQDDNQTDEMEVDNDEEESDADESEQNEHVSHEERQIEEQNDIEPSEEIVEESPNVTHDTTGRHRKKNLNKSPEVILHNISNQIDSFTAQGRNTSVRKTKSMIKNLNIKPSLAPPRDSTGFSDVAGNSSAEGSGWDSHRTTRKTLRQTFGKDFTPRKSLRALVMEKSAKRQTEHMEIHSETVKFPLANSTEMPEDSIRDVEDVVESDHEVSRNTRLATLEQYLQKIKAQNIEKRLKMEAAVRNSLKAPVTNSHSLFKIPIKPALRRPKPTQTKPKKQIKSIIPLDELPAEIIEDMKYKPPKRYRPPNASWVTKRLYKFLEAKLEPKYDYKARVRAEKLVETMYSFCKELRRQRVAAPDAVDVLKHELARLHVVRTHFDFYEFFHDFMPREVRIKVVPDIVNNIALPRHGVFSEILRGNTVHG